MANQRHRGVKLLALKNGDRYVARWRDPITRKQVQADMQPLGLTNATTRRLWAIQKATDLRTLKARIARGGSARDRQTIVEAQADYLAMFGNANSRSCKLPPLASIAAALAAVGITDVQDITAPSLAAWGDHVRRPANEHAISTRNWHLAACAAWLRWCRRRGVLPRVFDDEIKDGLRRTKAPRDPITVLQPAQIRKLLAACIAHDQNEDKEVAPFVLLVLLTGCRYMEAQGLAWAEVDASEKCIRLASGRSKNKLARTITLPETPTALELLGALRLRGGGKGRVFPWLDRRLGETLRGRLTDDYDAPVGWTWHQLRRTCGSLLVCSGVLGAAGVFLTAKRCGHSVQVAERHYLGAMTNLPKDAASLEHAGGFEAEARAIVRAVAGVQPKAVAGVSRASEAANG